VILDVPRYDFNWQMGYNTSIQVPAGTKLRVDAHYDNSVNNKFNPNPNRTVYYGEMTWEEMMSPFFGVIVPAGSDASKLGHADLLALEVLRILDAVGAHPDRGVAEHARQA
jgi:hypothetical protein